MKKKFINLSTTQIIMLSFLAVIFIGSLILTLPISTVEGSRVSYSDALFTATTATCVTGLVTLPTVTTWSFFGQVVILCLIQLGGLGVVTVVSGFMIALHKKIGITDRLLLQDAFNLNTLSGLVKFVKKVITGTILVEGIGALLYMTVFVPEFGVRGIWISIFNSVSAFCNAGIDIIAENSLCNYAHNPMINFTTCMLIIVGGIGYIVWWDLIRVLSLIKKQGLQCFKRLTMHSKIAIWMTVLLILSGTLAFFVLEYNNPLTIGEETLFNKLQISFFQSVTTRTAGFATVPQENLTNASAMVSMIFMFVGGSPVGTAGGVKTVTIAVLLITASSMIKNKNEITVFNRSIHQKAVKKAITVFSMSFTIMMVSSILLALVTDAPLVDILYETVSATATVGLTRNLTATLNIWGKLIIIVTMYLGRVGPISLALVLNSKKEKWNTVKTPYEEISVG
ncbi:MAG: potassium transporter KtrB [Clostridia bacterium]|nr:potassium transporter KtrB [Clostridia bacterium]